MGDRYTIHIKCADCGKMNEHWHAESSGSMSFVCVKCKKINWVSIGFTSAIVSKKEEDRRYKEAGFERISFNPQKRLKHYDNTKKNIHKRVLCKGNV